MLVPPTAVAGGFERARRLTASACRRVIRLCPGGHRYPLVDWVLSPVPELCEREGVAVVLDFAPEAVKWAEAVAFARHYSPVPMVILETARRTTENAEGLGEQDRAAILSENAQALRDGAYAEAWL